MDWLNVKARSFLGSLFRIPTRFKNGYHQFFDSVKGGWQWVHRRVAEIVSGKPIPPGYEVHHVNQDKLDNDPDNLQVLTKEEHQVIHRNERKNKFERITKKLTNTKKQNKISWDFSKRIEKIEHTKAQRINILPNAFISLGYDSVGCSRCGGSGYLPQFSHVAGGVCFACGGHSEGYSDFDDDYDVYDDYDDGYY